MKDTIKEEVLDTAVDHATHNEFRKDCSNCFAENLIVKYSARTNCPHCNGRGIMYVADGQDDVTGEICHCLI